MLARLEFRHSLPETTSAMNTLGKSRRLYAILGAVASLMIGFAPPVCRPASSTTPSQTPQKSSRSNGGLPESSRNNLLAVFAEGEAALRDGDLATAEKKFQAVLAADPKSGSAYANLGVVAMRRKQWDRALTLLQKARQLEPEMSGIELNIGLVQFRRANYAAAIIPFSEVVKAQPDSLQPRYLLGLCQVFTEHYTDAATTLEPLWSEMSSDVMYLYALDIAAHSSNNQELDDRALERMTLVGNNTAEYHLVLAKAYLNRQETDKAIAELNRAAEVNPQVPFLHFNLGLAYMRSGDNDRAESEFRNDIKIEPDLPDNYEQLGILYSRTQRDAQAEKSYRDALRYDPKRLTALLGLTKLFLSQQKFGEAATTAAAALKLDSNNQSAHFMRGQALLKSGRKEEGRVELAAAKKLLDAGLEKDRAAIDENRVPNPELTQQP
jgi:tetratricopeptide (TPR) repeat protein